MTVARTMAVAALVVGVLLPASNAGAQPADAAVDDVPVSAGPSGEQVEALTESLGESRTGGFYVDSDEDRFVVTVTDDAAARTVNEAGGVAERVTYDTAHLDAIQQKLDDTFTTPGTSWGVDVLANQVIVRADSTVSGADYAALEGAIAAHGDAAKIERIGGEITQSAGSPINGGDYIQNIASSCSYGFSVRSKTDGSKKSILTAGHCTRDWSSADWYKSNGLYIGYTTGSNYGSTGNDFGLIRQNNDTQVDYYGNVETAGGGTQDISYSRDSRVGEYVCASGYRTGNLCNSVGAKNQTVNYTSGVTVKGMDVACIDRNGGDSGGPLYAGTAALGILSGTNSSTCYSYFQPVNEALSWYGVEVY
ncbi:S1 family peptidase [Streptomyces sp. NPDC057137]|uniref:S1 family peptidase n=1 Tax=Streptomyces sp. NPDC057137 TaxID=3346030 RepID=UPI003629DC87